VKRQYGSDDRGQHPDETYLHGFPVNTIASRSKRAIARIGPLPVKYGALHSLDGNRDDPHRSTLPRRRHPCYTTRCLDSFESRR
jgi:hypothetical protein